ncbi:MAG TPA: hypothetical protein ENN81_11760 [Phycisphaerales bacterium]|nr:hypothetical protein [Phycisphaerales bacterium]
MHASAAKPKVVVVGGTYVDMALRCEEIPQAGQVAPGSGVKYVVSGPGPNQAAEAALCGCEVKLISKVGGDCFGEAATQYLAARDVDTSLVYVAEAKYTGLVVTLVNAAGENAVCEYAGANAALMPQEIEEAEGAIGDAAVCLIHGGLPQETIVKAIRCAEMHGTKVILNPARPMSTGGQAEGYPVEYFGADILIPNLYEAAEIAEQGPAVSIQHVKLLGTDLVARGAACVIITMGRRGCMVVDRDGTDQIAAFSVEVVDQTGRGDAFAGALAAFCAVGGDVREAAKFASAAGALACTKYGAMESMPKKAEIIELLQREDMG